MCGNIVLCGFMGCGKTTVGQVLAQKSGRSFLDLDQYIEQQQGKTVSQIFADDGEATFRRLENEAARELSRKDNLVIATGGGTVLKEENAALLRETGVIVLLNASLETLERRLDGVSNRPLLQRDDRQEFLRDLYARRIPLYRAAAQLCVEADGDPETVSEHILQKTELFFSKNS
ncbi:shikimate kinase [Faecalispora anaeroviscerum]|uniref:shikimate kinase n=1 Tax=Faecalispora anaeroviscerum TaxID=2991836 RepID=UPI0024B9586A|nr:shikimate kinase [Faecalispora anaeroviscerum]